ncbi:MAG: hypothetical protein WC836_01485 [Desulfobacula sp.]|jgi:hypothetical protein
MRGQYIFFPFSHISQNQMDALETFCPSFTFFPATKDLNHQPRLQELVKGGKSVPVFSSEDDQFSVDQTFEQYLSWAKVNKGNEHNLRFLLRDNPYFTSDSDLTSIKSHIRGLKKAIEPHRMEKDGLHQDLLFLKMAKQCDQENESIDAQLRDIDKTRNKMLTNLLGEEDPTDTVIYEEKTGTPDPGSIMTRERVQAWSRVMMHYNFLPKTDVTQVFITTSKAVTDYLETICSDVINALDINPIKVHENDCENITGWQQQIFEHLMCAAKGDADMQDHLPDVNDDCFCSGQIKLSLFSGNNIHHLFNLKEKQIAVCLVGLK